MPPFRRPNRRQRVEWPAWRYGPDGQSAQFEGPEDVPAGWVNKPQLQYEAPEPKQEICKETTAAELREHIGKIDPRWGKAKIWEELEKVLNK